jgi:hypothetical protein
MELADMPGHPARVAARRHKAAVEAWWTNVLGEAGVASPAARARELVILLEGTSTLILIHGNRSYAEAGAEAARRLVCHRNETAVERTRGSKRHTSKGFTTRK